MVLYFWSPAQGLPWVVKCVNRWCPWEFRVELVGRDVTRSPKPPSPRSLLLSVNVKVMQPEHLIL